MGIVLYNNEFLITVDDYGRSAFHRSHLGVKERGEGSDEKKEKRENKYVSYYHTLGITALSLVVLPSHACSDYNSY